MLKKFFKSSVLIPVAVGCLAVVPACSSDTPSDDDDNGGNGGSSGTMGGGAGTGNTGACTPGGDFLAIPSVTGWVDHMDACNDVGVQGAWYPYGDQYGDGEGDAKCLKVGMHMSSECAQITMPDPPPATGFPNLNGEMRTTGKVEPILACPTGLTTSGCPSKDYSNMWGAGIGWDFNANKGAPDGDGMKNVWDPDLQVPPVLGIAVTVTGLPIGADFRIEFPMQLNAAEAALDSPPITIANPTTDSHSAGAPYWGAQAKGDAMFPKSPVTDGVEVKIYFDDTTATTGIESPKKTLYKFDRHRMLGIQFHVVAGAAVNYDFTVKNVRLLRTR